MDTKIKQWQEIFMPRKDDIHDAVAVRGGHGMDCIKHYRDLIKQYITEYAELMWIQPVEGLETIRILDEASDQYILLTVGWENGKRSRYTTLHVRLKEGKIWIEEDWTEDGIANELIRAGVPKEDIVLAFNPPNLRHLTDFAVA
jgi:XisI protein